MAHGDQLAFLLYEVALWREQGLIGEQTYQVLRRRYRAWDPPPVRRQLELVFGSSLDQALEREAQRLVAADPPAEPPLFQELEREVAFHAELERVVQEGEPAVPPATTEQAAAGVARDLVCGEVLVGSAPPTPVSRALTHDAQDRTPVSRRVWSRWVRPFLDQYGVWLAGGLLVLFGSIYFLRLVWDDLSSLALHGVIAASLFAYAGGFFGAGYMLSRRQAQGVGRILFCFAVTLLPLTSVAAGELAGQLVRAGGAGWVGAAAIVALALTLQGTMLAVMGGLYERRCIGPLLRPGLALSLAIITVAPLSRLAPAWAGLTVTLVGFAALSAGLLALSRPPTGALHSPVQSGSPASRAVNLRGTLLFVGGTLLGLMLVLTVRVQLASPVAPTHLASLLAALAALLITCDHRLRVRSGGAILRRGVEHTRGCARSDRAARLSALGVALHGLLLASVAVALVGLATLGYFDVWARINVLVTSGVALVWFALAASRHGSGALTHIAATVGLLTYFFLPAPFTALIRLAQGWINAALGYQDAPLPVAYYGLAFIPYLAALTVAAMKLRPTGARGQTTGQTTAQARLSRDLQRFVLVLSALLVPLAVLGRGDLRPMLWTWPIYTAAAFVWAWLFRRPWLRLAGHLIAIAFTGVLGVWFSATVDPRAPTGVLHSALQSGSLTLRMGPPLLLALHGLALAVAAVLLRRLGKAGHALVLPSLTGLGLGLLALPLHPPSWTILFIPLAAVASGLGLNTVVLRSRVTAHLTALALVSATVAGLVAVAPGRAEVAWVLLLLGCVGLLLVPRSRSLGPRSLREITAGPTTVVALLSLALFFGWCTAMSVAPVMAALVTTVMLAYLMLVTRSVAATLLSALGAAGAAAAVVGPLWASAWPPVLALISALYLLAASRTASGRAVVLVISAFVVQAVAVLAGLSNAVEPEGVNLGWVAVTLGGLSLFSLGATVARAGRFQLVCFATASSLGLALGLHHVVGGSVAGAWHVGALSALLGLAWWEVSLAPTLWRAERGNRRSSAARWIAMVHLALPLLLFGVFLGLSALLCGTDGGLVLSLVSLNLGWGAALCTALCLLATGRSSDHPDTVLSRVHRQLFLGAAVGLALVLFRLLWPTAHLSLMLGGLALLLVQSRTSLAWPLSLLGAAFLSSHGHPMHLTAALASGFGTLLLAWRRHPRFGALVPGWSLALVLALQTLVLWVAQALSTGRYPAAAVMALMAPVALASGSILAIIARRRLDLRLAGIVGRGAMVAAGSLAVGAVVGCLGSVPAFVSVLGAGTLLGLTMELVRQGRRDGRSWQLHGAVVALTLLYLVLRATVLAAAGPGLDAVVLVLAAQTALWLARGLTRDPMGTPLRSAALLWPVLGLAVLPRLGGPGAAVLALLLALHFAAAVRVVGSRHLGVPAMLLGNLSLLCAYGAAGWSDLLLYAVPVAVTLLGLVHLYAAEIGARGSGVLRGLVLVGLYSMGISRALLGFDPLYTLLLVPTLCVTGILAGTLLRVRVYVAVGVAFLGADLVINLVHHGLARPHLGALFLTLLGLLLVSGMVLFSLKRERILRRYSAILGQLRTWE